MFRLFTTTRPCYFFRSVQSTVYSDNREDRSSVALRFAGMILPEKDRSLPRTFAGSSASDKIPALGFARH